MLIPNADSSYVLEAADLPATIYCGAISAIRVVGSAGSGITIRDGGASGTIIWRCVAGLSGKGRSSPRKPIAINDDSQIAYVEAVAAPTFISIAVLGGAKAKTFAGTFGIRMDPP